MGVAVIEDICAGCIAAGMDKDMPTAIVENATAGIQRKFIGTVGTLDEIARRNSVESPAFIIIGKVCQLSERYDWFSKKPLLGRRIIVARAKPGVSKLSDNLRELGCHVIEMPCANIIPLDFFQTFEKIKSYSWLVFTSATSVNIFFDYLIENKLDIRVLGNLKIACVGTETEKEVNKRGIIIDYCPSEYNGIALANGLCERIKNDERLLIARAKDGAEDLTRILASEGINFDDVPIYEKTRNIKEITIDNADFAAFTSSSSVEWFAESAVNLDFNNIKAVCIGERTANTAKSYGMEVYISEESTIDSMINKIKELCI
jgi:uroporphyrinogen III methyltransferase/synthase